MTHPTPPVSDETLDVAALLDRLMEQSQSSRILKHKRLRLNHDDFDTLAREVLAMREEMVEAAKIADDLIAVAAEAHTRHFNPGVMAIDPPRFEDADDCFASLLEEAKRLRAALKASS